jgi:CheY-like chemotaxis protein
MRDTDMTGLSSPPSRPLILVIDDNVDMTEMLCDYFDSQNVQCKVINDGRTGLEELRKEGEKYAVVLLDLAMPEFSGYDVINELKKEKLLDLKNIIIFTASSVTDMQIQELIHSGAKGVLKKPISLDDLNDVMEKYAARSL